MKQTSDLKQRYFLRYACSILCLCFLVSCHSPSPTQPTHFSDTAMTIAYHISIGDALTEPQINHIQEIVETTFQEIDKVYNKWNPDSELSQLNRLPAHTTHSLSPQLYQFLQRLDHFVKLSEGRFDPTIEPLQQLWKSKLEQGSLPNLEEINDLKPCIGWKNLHFAEGVFYKEDSRTQLDLGGVAKGLCVDLLLERLHKAGFCHLFIEWGGEIRTLGLHPSGRPWRIFISHPASPDPAHALAHLDLFDQALATSGDYFQYWKASTDKGEAKIYCHIFNPLTLTPLEVKSGSVASASLLASDCVTADALAKVLMLFDTLEEAHCWINNVQLDFPHLACWIATR